MSFFENLKIVEDSLQIARPIGNFILKDLVMGLFLIKWASNGTLFDKVGNGHVISYEVSQFMMSHMNTYVC